jgi:hypothetical protein
MTTVGGAGEADFAIVFERSRRERLVLCYRMTGWFSDAEDLTQETFLRAWRGREGFRHASSQWAWLYRVATNGGSVCDALVGPAAVEHGLPLVSRDRRTLDTYRAVSGRSTPAVCTL